MTPRSPCRWFFSFCLLGSVAAQEPAPAPTPQPRASTAADAVLGPGWRWELVPTRLRDGWAPEGQTAPRVWRQHGESTFVASGLVQIAMLAEGTAVVTHVRTQDLGLRGSAAPQFQAVLFRREGEPLQPMMSMGMTRGGLGETRYVFPAVAEANVERFALGVLDLDGKLSRAKAGEERAQALGARVLPLPLLGKPIEFELPTVDGGTFKSAEHRGEVILLDAWATW